MTVIVGGNPNVAAYFGISDSAVPPHAGFLAQLPVSALLDGELVALDDGSDRSQLPLFGESRLSAETTSPAFSP